MTAGAAWVKSFIILEQGRVQATVEGGEQGWRLCVNLLLGAAHTLPPHHLNSQDIQVQNRNKHITSIDYQYRSTWCLHTTVCTLALISDNFHFSPLVLWEVKVLRRQTILSPASGTLTLCIVSTLHCTYRVIKQRIKPLKFLPHLALLKALRCRAVLRCYGVSVLQWYSVTYQSDMTLHYT